MEKSCEMCLKLVHPPANQSTTGVVCPACAVEVYKGLDDKHGIGYASILTQDWFTFVRSGGCFSDQVDKILAEICPQCRKRH